MTVVHSHVRLATTPPSATPRGQHLPSGAKKTVSASSSATVGWFPAVDVSTSLCSRLVVRTINTRLSATGMGARMRDEHGGGPDLPLLLAGLVLVVLL